MTLKAWIGKVESHVFWRIRRTGIFDRLSDEAYLRMLWRRKFHRRLNLENPQTFNEKLQWLKLYDRNPEYTRMVDKYEAKNYVAERIGEEYIIPTLGVWDRFEDIDFDSLPDQFVLKCTHDSGGLVICRDKSKLDMEKARKKIEASLSRNYFWASREWPYKNVRARIIAEKYMVADEENTEKGLIDYKFYCFGGEVKFLYVSQGLEHHPTAHISFVTMDWKPAAYERSDFSPFEILPEKPVGFDEMLRLSQKLSQDMAFLRVDLYQIGGRVYFSELTFSPCSGFHPFRNSRHDLEIGKMLVLPQKNL